MSKKKENGFNDELRDGIVSHFDDAERHNRWMVFLLLLFSLTCAP